jgi:hypothetical protein
MSSHRKTVVFGASYHDAFEHWAWRCRFQTDADSGHQARALGQALTVFVKRHMELDATLKATPAGVGEKTPLEDTARSHTNIAAVHMDAGASLKAEKRQLNHQTSHCIIQSTASLSTSVQPVLTTSGFFGAASLQSRGSGSLASRHCASEPDHAAAQSLPGSAAAEAADHSASNDSCTDVASEPQELEGTCSVPSRPGARQGASSGTETRIPEDAVALDWSTAPAHGETGKSDKAGSGTASVQESLSDSDCCARRSQSQAGTVEYNIRGPSQSSQKPSSTFSDVFSDTGPSQRSPAGTLHGANTHSEKSSVSHSVSGTSASVHGVCLVAGT